ncbi:MAG: UDP-N-acetylglucosamine 2-epimerase (non-hydrolyzing) [Candidatus Aminicenantes bacterium]|nr:UDP-N-acetylglucosamine 2-epimerase (non-hydrolyzing) [Candidatus Aminicenantes bacterium]
MKNIKVIVVAGARPNFMKVNPLLKQIANYNSEQRQNLYRINSLLVHTGQHYDKNMSALFFRELGIPKPDINLEVGSGSHAVQTANILTGFEAVCAREKPDWVVVVGDVNSTMACTLVCSKMGIRVAHIEAGLRSFDRTMPEEINRIVTDALADLLLTPSEDAVENLLHEGISKNKIKFVGNIMIDSLLDNLPKARSSDILAQLKLEPASFVYVTLHRPANVDEQTSLSSLMAGMEQLSRSFPVIWPIHPRTSKKLTEFGLGTSSNKRLFLLDPLGYHASLCLTENARFVLTDSGGLQEEATFFRTPCLTLRPNTERPITLSLGSNRLTKLERFLDDVTEVLEGPERQGQVPPLWDGHAAERTLQQLLSVS